MAIIRITMLSNPSAFFGAMLPIKPRVITMFAQGEGHTDDLVCKWRGLRSLQPPRFLKAMDACKRKQESGRRQHRCLQKTSIRSSPCGSFMFAIGESYAGHFVCRWGGLCPPNPPLFKDHGCLPPQKKSQVVATIDACKKQASGRLRVDHSCFALGEGYAGHFVCK